VCRNSISLSSWPIESAFCTGNLPVFDLPQANKMPDWKCQIMIVKTTPPTQSFGKKAIEKLSI